MCFGATFDPNSSNWTEACNYLADLLVAENPLVLQTWLDALRPVRSVLVEPLSAIFRNQQRAESDRTLATRILLDFVADKPDVLVGLLTNSDQKQFATVFPGLQADRNAAIALLEAEFDKVVADTATEEEKEVFARQQANAAIALLKLGQPDKAWTVLRHKPDPRARTYFIHWFSPLAGDPQILINRLDEEPDDSIRRALLQTLGEFSEDQLSAPQRDPLIDKLLVIYENEPDPGLHGSAEWLLRRWGAAEQLVSLDMRLQTNDEQLKQQAEKRQWYLTTQGHTIMILDADTFQMGSPDSEPDHRSNEVLHRRRIGHRFAISAKEVTRKQFTRFQLANPGIAHFDIEQYSQTDDSPQVAVDWYDAAAYCNWLSEKEGIPKEQWCYLPISRGAKVEYSEGMQPAPDYLTRTGYRLPTEAEWEYACRSGTVTGRYFGQTETLMQEYAWHSANAQKRTWPVATLKPNDFGLFDMYGNAVEWCHERYREYPPIDSGDSAQDTPDSEAIQDRASRVLRGGAFYVSGDCRSANRLYWQPDIRLTYIGFRVSRTYP